LLGEIKTLVSPTISLPLLSNANYAYPCYLDPYKIPNARIAMFYSIRLATIFSLVVASQKPQSTTTYAMHYSPSAKLLHQLLVSLSHHKTLSLNQPIFFQTLHCVAPVTLSFVSALPPLILAKRLPLT
jgi:hypothetical protein